jgi:hypothetical protein
MVPVALLVPLYKIGLIETQRPGYTEGASPQISLRHIT